MDSVSFLDTCYNILNSIINFSNGIIWDYLLVYLLLAVGLYFTIRSRFIQVREFKHMFTVLKNSNKADKSGISSFQALCTSLAARVGTGNLIGVALAISLGGPGAIFWMWMVALIGMSSSFVESTLAQLYKTRDSEGNFRGGPAYYMEKGLNMRWMGVLFSIFIIIAFGLVFNAVQANSIANATKFAFGFDPFYVGIGVVVLSGIVILGGLRTIARTAELIVPIMSVAYLLLAFWIIGHHIERIPEVITMIVKSAFGFQEAGAGFSGAMLSKALSLGIKRGLFSNEAGLGSAPNAAASATPYPPHPASQGYVQMLGVFIDTIVICSATALIILCSGVLDNPGEKVIGIELTQRALSTAVGDWAGSFVAIAIFFFAFTSIIANYAYAENNFVFLEKNHPHGLLAFRFVVLAMVMFGALAEVPLVWNMADLSMGLMAITNLVAILLLSNVAFKLAKDYSKQRKAGKLPTFNPDDFPEVKHQIELDIWGKDSKEEKTTN